MIEQFIVALSPVVVALVTQGIKQGLSVKRVIGGGFSTSILRLLAGVCSFGTVLTGAWLGGTEIDPTSIDTLAQSVAVFFGATGVYFFVKK
jgi:hypothetical protein